MSLEGRAVTGPPPLPFSLHVRSQDGGPSLERLPAGALSEHELKLLDHLARSSS
jgi:hypothetical protein